MIRYKYKAINARGKVVSGVIASLNSSMLESLLLESGLELITYHEENKRLNFLASQIRDKDIISICVHIEQLDRAGFSILDSLADLRDTTDSPRIRDLLSEVHESIKNGSLISEAFGKHPKIFTEVFVGLIKVGEKTGKMYEAFASIISHLKWTLAIKRKVKKAVRYPSFVLALILGMVVAMMTMVVPQLAEFLASQGHDLPIYTRSLIAISGFFDKHLFFALIIITLPFSIAIAIKIAARGKLSRYFDTLKLRIPFVGPTIRKIEVARFCNFFSITFAAGIGVLESIALAQTVVHNSVIKDAIDDVMTNVSEGTSLNNALAISGQFPSLVVRMFRIGEETGNIEQALQNIKFFYDHEIDESIDRLISSIQPMLTLVMGGFIIWIVLAVFSPLYGSFSRLAV